MPEVKVQRRPERVETALEPFFEMPLFRGSLFQMNPFNLMRQFTDEMDKFFERTPGILKSDFWMPVIEAKRKNGDLLITVELPGLKKDEIKVQVTKDALVLEGERKREEEEETEQYVRSERAYGRFYRAIPLPDGAEPNKAHAEFHNGVLTIMIPCPVVKVKPVEIPVHEPEKVTAAVR